MYNLYMNSKKLTTLFIIIFGFAGGYVPALWGAPYFSFSSLIFNTLGSILGVWLAFKITRY